MFGYRKMLDKDFSKKTSAAAAASEFCGKTILEEELVVCRGGEQRLLEKQVFLILIWAMEKYFLKWVINFH